LAASASAVEVQIFAKASSVKAKTEAAESEASAEAPLRALPVKATAPVAKTTVPVAAITKLAISPVSSAPKALPSALAAKAAQTAPVAKPVNASALSMSPVTASSPAPSEFTFKDRAGKVTAAPIVDGYQKRRIVYPLAKIDPRLSPKLTRAASIAQERAHAHSKSRCWRYVKNALLASGIISSYPKTPYAKQAGDELVRDYGFKKLPIRDPYAAPVGAVLVYGSRRAAGHVEIRTKTGFVSDFQNKKPSPRPLLGIYAKA